MIATYEYRCAQCQSRFELRSDWNARDAIAQCPICQSANIVRVFTPVMAITRGADGSTQMIGAGGCGGCTVTNCGGCPTSRY